MRNAVKRNMMFICVDSTQIRVKNAIEASIGRSLEVWRESDADGEEANYETGNLLNFP